VTAHFPEPAPSLLAELPHPVLQAPMAGGGSTPELAAAVSAAGGLGFLAAGYRTPDEVREQIARTRRLTGAPFGVNVFVPGPDPDGAAAAAAAYRAELEKSGEAERYGVALPADPGWDDDHYRAKLDLLAELAVPVVGFTFGCPDPDDLVLLQSAGSEVAVTVTSAGEALEAVRAGADILVVQGPEAGGHRGSFTPGRDDRDDSAPEPTLGRLLAEVRESLEAEEVRPAVVAAGGMATGADIAAVLAAGADAAQLGTAFLVTPESGAHPLHKAALGDPAATTAVTTAFSGRPARGIANRFLVAHGATAPRDCYPRVHHLTSGLRRASAGAGDAGGMALWAGVAQARVRALPAAELVAALVAECGSAAAP
jgi:nitronate monooxygenase